MFSQAEITMLCFLLGLVVAIPILLVSLLVRMAQKAGAKKIAIGTAKNAGKGIGKMLWNGYKGRIGF